MFFKVTVNPVRSLLLLFLSLITLHAYSTRKESDETIIVNPIGGHTHTLIFMHGLEEIQIPGFLCSLKRFAGFLKLPKYFCSILP